MSRSRNAPPAGWCFFVLFAVYSELLADPANGGISCYLSDFPSGARSRARARVGGRAR